MARSLPLLLLATAALGGCASAPPPQVVYVERPYPSPPPRVMMAPPAWHYRECGPPAYAMHPPRSPMPPAFRHPHGPKGTPPHHNVPARRRARRVDHERDSAQR